MGGPLDGRRPRVSTLILRKQKKCTLRLPDPDLDAICTGSSPPLQGATLERTRQVGPPDRRSSATIAQYV